MNNESINLLLMMFASCLHDAPIASRGLFRLLVHKHTTYVHVRARILVQTHLKRLLYTAQLKPTSQKLLVRFDLS
jgi:hypothetical protein